MLFFPSQTRFGQRLHFLTPISSKFALEAQESIEFDNLCCTNPKFQHSWFASWITIQNAIFTKEQQLSSTWRSPKVKPLTKLRLQGKKTALRSSKLRTWKCHFFFAVNTYAEIFCEQSNKRNSFYLKFNCFYWLDFPFINKVKLTKLRVSALLLSSCFFFFISDGGAVDKISAFRPQGP